MLSFCGLREKPARKTSESVARYAVYIDSSATTANSLALTTASRVTLPNSTRNYPDSTVTTSGYDNGERLASATSGGVTTSYVYDAASNLVTTTLPSANGYVETNTYDRAGRLTDSKNAKTGSTLSEFAV